MGGKAAASAFTEAFKTGFAIGQTKKEERREKALSEAYSLMDEVGTKQVTSDDIGVQAIPQPSEQMQGIQEQMVDEPDQYTQQEQMMRDQVYGEDFGTFDRPEYKTSYITGLDRRAKIRSLLADAGVHGKEQRDFFKDFDGKVDDTAFRLRDAAVAAWAGGNYDKAAELMQQSYSFIGDGADAHVRAIYETDPETGEQILDENGLPKFNGMAVSFTDSTSGYANQEQPMLFDDPRKMASMLGRAIDYNKQIGYDRQEQVMLLADALNLRQTERQKHDIELENKQFGLSKDRYTEIEKEVLKLQQDENVREWANEERLDLASYIEMGRFKLAENADERADRALDLEQWNLEVNAMDKYMTQKTNRLKLATGLTKAAASGISSGYGTNAKDALKNLMDLDKAMSTAINDLHDKAGQVDSDYMMQTKSTGSAFAMVNHGRTPNELAQVAVNYTDLQASARAQAERIVKDSNEFRALTKQYGVNVPPKEYQALVRAETRKLMAPHHTKLADGKTYYVTDGGAYQVPDRYISGNHTVATLHDAYSQAHREAMVELANDPDLQAMAKKVGLPGADNSVSASSTSTSTTGVTGVGNATTRAGRAGVDIPADTGAATTTDGKAPPPSPGKHLDANDIRKSGAPRPHLLRDKDPLKAGLIPESAKDFKQWVKDTGVRYYWNGKKEARELNNSLMKVRLYSAVAAGHKPNRKGQRIQKPTLEDMKKALSHPGISPSEKQVLQKMVRSMTSITTGLTRREAVPADEAVRQAIEVK